MNLEIGQRIKFKRPNGYAYGQIVRFEENGDLLIQHDGPFAVPNTLLNVKIDDLLFGENLPRC